MVWKLYLCWHLCIKLRFWSCTLPFYASSLMIRAKHTLNTNSSDWIQNPAVPPVSDLILCDIYACLTDEYVPLLDSEKLTGFIVFNPGLLWNQFSSENVCFQRVPQHGGWYKVTSRVIFECRASEWNLRGCCNGIAGYLANSLYHNIFLNCRWVAWCGCGQRWITSIDMVQPPQLPLRRCGGRVE